MAKSILLGLVALWATPSLALSTSFCSSFNTAGGQAEEIDQFQSNGLCDTTCDGFSYAILSGSSCWCSNFAPAESANVDLDECDTPCPGYPDDSCGNTEKGLYQYLFRDVRASGTKTPSSSASPTSTSTGTKTTAALATTTLNGVEQTVAPDGTIMESDGGGLSTGAAVGIAVGVAVLVIGLSGVGFFMWWKKRKEKESEMNDSTPRNSSPGLASDGKRNSQFLPIDQRMEFHRDLYAPGLASRASTSSLRDDVDYSRRVLRATNPDPAL